MLVLIAFIILLIDVRVIPNGRAVVFNSFIAALQPIEDFTPQPLVLLCALAILINLMLCIFNLLPIPPLDGSRLVRNMLPYNAVQTYDRIPFWVSYLLMIFVGGTIISAFVTPALRLVLHGLAHL
jgi:Zn-dependent protease